MTKISLFLSVILACQCQLIYSSSSSSTTTISNTTTSSNSTVCTSVTTNGNTVTSCTSNSSSSSTSSSSVEFIKYLDPIVKVACSSNNFKDKLIEEIQKEIQNKGKLVLNLYQNIANLGQELKKKEDFYEKLANKSLDDAFLPIQKLLQVFNILGERNLTDESLDALKLIEDAKKEAFKTQRNYGCYAEKLVKLYLEMNSTINKYIQSISITNIYNKCNAKSPPTCQSYNNFLKCIALELNDFLVFIDTTYRNATELNVTTTIKDVKYQEKVENWYKNDAKIQIDTVIKTVEEWISQVLEQNEQAKRRCDELVLTQIKNHYNDQLPKLTAAAKCIADSYSYQKSFNYCKDVYFCGKFEGALSVFINSPIEDVNVLEIFKSLSKTYYEKALETFQTYIKSLVSKLDINFQLIQNETNAFDAVRIKLSNSYSLSNICNATNIQSSSYCKCVSNYGSEQIQLLSSIVLSNTQQCGNQYTIMNERKSEIAQFVSNLTSDIKIKAELEASSVIKLNSYVDSVI